MNSRPDYSNLLDVVYVTYKFDQSYDNRLDEHLAEKAYEAAERLLDDDKNLPLDPTKYNAEERAIIEDAAEHAFENPIGNIWL